MIVVGLYGKMKNLNKMGIKGGQSPLIPEVIGMDDASEAKWHPINDIPKLGFDHDLILKDVLQEMGTDPINCNLY